MVLPHNKGLKDPLGSSMSPVAIGDSEARLF